ncbi:MAG: PEP/pyruvate-binding domain-containing protein [SAR324 cluster bacterium]
MASLVIPLSAPEANDAGRFGSKAATLAALAHAGLPTPGGWCVAADAYRAQVAALGLDPCAQAAAAPQSAASRRHALEMRLGLLEGALAPAIQDALLGAWRALRADGRAAGAVRSSALVEDQRDASYAGQFESYLGLESEEDFVTAVRACWAALWSPRVCRYMAGHGMHPSRTAMAVMIQPVVAARAAGGGLSRDGEGGMLLTATPGLGGAVAQGVVVPERVMLDPTGAWLRTEPGRDGHRPGCVHDSPAEQAAPFEPHVSAVPESAGCLAPAQATALGAMMRRAEAILGEPVEIEWALSEAAPVLLQARPLKILPALPPGRAGRPLEAQEIQPHGPGLRGQPAGSGWGTGRACVVNCECELTRVAPGDVLVTRVAGPALSPMLSRVAGVVAELGGSTSHLAALARERGIPMVLGVPDATRRIPDGTQVAVDGMAGLVRWSS